ncbi:general odorant-binding protein 28a-like [Eupeodes corollae]|uniref:OBP17 n=1 Tax=Eupeodes corollae TaxID=290404 RepID=A0A8F9S115_9MUSC|nr:general odorant-binding protein 28a-like [Eupeodes corollae]QYL00043.1 OBP17 [Eupeodes corollae]
MKAISVFVLCTLAVAGKGSAPIEAIDLLRSLSAECLQELGASEAVFDEMMKNLPATSMDIKCLRACIMKQVSVLTPEGKLHKDNALKLVEMHVNGDAEKMKIARAVGDACEGIAVPDDHCEAAELYKMCMVDEAKKHGINEIL